MLPDLVQTLLKRDEVFSTERLSSLKYAVFVIVDPRFERVNELLVEVHCDFPITLCLLMCLAEKGEHGSLGRRAIVIIPRRLARCLGWQSREEILRLCSSSSSFGLEKC